MASVTSHCYHVSMTQADDRRNRAREKQDFVTTWTMSHPLATMAEARRVLFDKFGETMNTGFINQAFKVARTVAAARALGQPAQPTGSCSPPHVAGARLPEIVAELKAAGITRIEIRGDTFDVSFAVASGATCP